MRPRREGFYPRLTDHDDEGWHLHYRDLDQTLPHVLEAVISVGTALHLTNRGMGRQHRCDAGIDPSDQCRNVVVDVTCNGRQRYCTTMMQIPLGTVKCRLQITL